MNRRLLQGDALLKVMEQRAETVVALLVGEDHADIKTLKFELASTYFDGAIAALDSHIATLKAPAKVRK